MVDNKLRLRFGPICHLKDGVLYWFVFIRPLMRDILYTKLDLYKCRYYTGIELYDRYLRPVLIFFSMAAPECDIFSFSS